MQRSPGGINRGSVASNGEAEINLHEREPIRCHDRGTGCTGPVVHPQAGHALDSVGMANSLGRAVLPYCTLTAVGTGKGAFLPVPDIPISRQIHDRE